MIVYNSWFGQWTWYLVVLAFIFGYWKRDSCESRKLHFICWLWCYQPGKLVPGPFKPWLPPTSVHFIPSDRILCGQRSFGNHPREARIFADAVYDCFYNDNSVVSALANKRERYIEATLQNNDDQQALSSNIYVLGVAFNVNEIREDESTDDSSTSSSYSSGSGSVDREERIGQLLE